MKKIIKTIKILLKKILGQNFFISILRLKEGMAHFFYGRELLKKRSAFYKAFINTNDLCFDVGANVGNRVEIFLALGAKVIAVEPQSSCISILNKKFGEKITIVNKGLGEKIGILEMFIADNSTISSFSKEWIDVAKKDRFKEYSWNKKETIEITTLDNLINEYGVPHFIKIDVEGFEFEVLKGLSQPIKYISIEYNLPENLEITLQCLAKIKALKTKIECNYSIKETMEFALEKWLPINEMEDLIKTEKFITTGFGDIYIRM
jgi:FkbM family methyltransferase